MTASHRRRLGRSFFGRPPEEVAPDLLGRVLVKVFPGGVRLAGRIVETEAYGQSDPASHSFGGRTARNEAMFGRGGLLYVYFTYGMHFCMNVVTEAEGEGSAVLLRATEPLSGLEEMFARRGVRDVKMLCSGPARLCQAFGVDGGDAGTDLVADGSMRIEAGWPPSEVSSGPRVGIRKATGTPWRFWVTDDTFVSRRRAGALAERPRAPFPTGSIRPR